MHLIYIPPHFQDWFLGCFPRRIYLIFPKLPLLKLKNKAANIILKATTGHATMEIFTKAGHY